jgi:hypothetical protein
MESNKGFDSSHQPNNSLEGGGKSGLTSKAFKTLFASPVLGISNILFEVRLVQGSWPARCSVILMSRQTEGLRDVLVMVMRD